MDSTTLFDNSPAAKKLGKAALSRWKLETLTGLLGYRALMNHQAESEKNQQAENQHVRKSVWGYEGKKTENESDDDEMGHTILGDVNHPAPIIMPQPQQSQLAPMLAGMGIAAASGLAGYYLSNKDDTPPVQPPPPIEFQDETISVGLGRIEEYLKVNE